VSFLKKVLNFLSLLSNDEKLSLTSVGIYIVLIKVAIAPSPSIGDIGALLLVLLNYAHKRYTGTHTPENPPQVDELHKSMNDIQSKVNAMAIKIGLSK
jgi:hypothetical protein